MSVQDKEARELQAAQQEVVALRARVHQLESDTHSSSSLELKNLSLQQVCAVLDTAHMRSVSCVMCVFVGVFLCVVFVYSFEPSVLVTIQLLTGLAKAPCMWQRTVCQDDLAM